LVAKNLLFFLFFDFNDLTALIMAAVRAHRVRQAHLTAVRALGQIQRGQVIMRTPAVAPSF